MELDGENEAAADRLQLGEMDPNMLTYDDDDGAAVDGIEGYSHKEVYERDRQVYIHDRPQNTHAY